MLFRSEETVIEQSAVLLGNAPNHYHWLMDYLPRLSIVEAFRDLAELPLVVGGDLEAGQAQMLGHLGIAPERLLKVDLERVYRFRQLWVPAQLVDRMRLHPGAIEWMHARIARPGQCVRRMFISRRDAARRRLVNEDEIIEIVSAHGFEIVLPAMLNQVDQARLFTEAASVIGVAGAGHVSKRLVIARTLSLARDAKSDCIHPGWSLPGKLIS